MPERFATLAQIVAAMEEVLGDLFEGEQVDWDETWAEVEDRMQIELDDAERDAVLQVLAA